MTILTALFHQRRPAGRPWQMLPPLLLLFFTLTAATPWPAAGANNSDHTYQVLILNSYHQGFSWTDDIVTAVMTTMSAQPNKVEFRIEYMDSKRTLDEQLDEMVLRTLAFKYQHLPPDVIITSDDHALNFMKHHHQQIFPDVPVVFCGVNNIKEALSVDREYFTGLVETQDISANIALALHLLPKVGEIVIVSDGTPTSIATRQMAVEAAPDYPDITFTYLNGEELSTDEMLANLRRLEATSAVIAPAWYLDKDGNTFDNKAIYPRLAKASPVPVFGTSNASLGLGIIGGKVNSGTSQGEYAANQALRILSGEVTSKDLPVETASQNHYMFDYRQLIRFAIDERLLPPGSEILYRPFSFYRTYRYLVLSVFAVFCLFALLIVFLLLNVNRLRLIRNSLARSEENLRVTFHSIADAVITTDISGHITRMNRIAETLTGWREAEANGKPLEEVFKIFNTVSKAKCANPVTTIISTGTITNLTEETILVSRNSATYRIADSCALIRNDADVVIGVVLVFRDITKNYLREAQLQQSQKMAAVGQLAGGVAHDFNNILSVIIGFAEIIRDDCPAGSAIINNINQVIKAGNRAKELVKQISAFNHHGKNNKVPLQPEIIIKEVLKLLRSSLPTTITIEQDIESDVGFILADPTQIHQIVMNLCTNAFHAMEMKGGTLTISLHKKVLSHEDFGIELNQQPGNFVQLSVRDTGTGIAPENREKIFDPYFTTKGVDKGSGLGLAIVHGIVQSYGGSITCDSQLGEGTVFHVILPTVEEQAVQEIEIPEIIPGGKEHILLIDDEEMFVEMDKILLERLGYLVTTRTNSIEALATFRNQPEKFDLMITDQTMPGMTGVDLSREILQIRPDMPIIVCTGYSNLISAEKVKSLGIKGFAIKPIAKKDIATLIRKVLDREN